MFANIWGEAGVMRMIDLFAQEMYTSMQLMGVSNVNQLNTSYVGPVFPFVLHRIMLTPIM